MSLLTLVLPWWVRVMSKDVPPMSTVMKLSMSSGWVRKRPAIGADAGPELMALTAREIITSRAAMPPLDWK